MRKFLLEYHTPILHDYLNDFVDFVCDKLSIAPVPLEIQGKTGSASFGNYRPSDRSIRVAVDGRHTADILRTIAHELVHEAQNSRGDLDSVELDSLEYEANAVAGMLMREYNKLHPELYDVEEEPETDELYDVGAAQGSLENAGYGMTYNQTPSYEEGIQDAQPMRPPYPVEFAESINSIGGGYIASVSDFPSKEPGIRPQHLHHSHEDHDWHHQHTHIQSLHGKSTTSQNHHISPRAQMQKSHTKDRNLTLQKWRQDHESHHQLSEMMIHEDGVVGGAPINSSGSGAVAGIGVGPQGEPGIYPKKKPTPMFKRKTLTQLRKK